MRTGFKFRFSLLVYLLLITGVVAAFAYIANWYRTGSRVVSATVRAKGDEVVIQTNEALLTSPFVLESALRPPAIHTLPIFSGIVDKRQWLEDHLRVSRASDSELLTLYMFATPGEAVDAEMIVKAVVSAHIQEWSMSVINDANAKIKTLDAMSGDLAKEIHDLEKYVASVSKEVLDNDGRGYTEIRLAAAKDSLLNLQRQTFELKANARMRARDVQLLSSPETRRRKFWRQSFESTFDVGLFD